MYERKIVFNHICRFILLSIFIFTLVACSSNEEKDFTFVRKNLNDFQVETIPYEDKISFTLTTDEIIKGSKEPKKIETIHDTDVYITEIKEKENEPNIISINVGFDGHFKSPDGTMISMRRYNDDNTVTTSLTEIKVFNDKGEQTQSFGYTSGDSEGKYGQFITYFMEKDIVEKSKEWSFEISNLFLLNYEEK